MLLIVKEILFVRTIGNVKRTVQRKCVLMLGCKGLNYSKTKLLTWSFSGLQTLTHKMWSISQSTGLSLWNIRKNSTTILKSLERKSFPVNRVKKNWMGICESDWSLAQDKTYKTPLPINPRAENSKISHWFVSCWSANVLIVEAKDGVATMSSSS